MRVLARGFGIAVAAVIGFVVARASLSAPERVVHANAEPRVASPNIDELRDQIRGIRSELASTRAGSPTRDHLRGPELALDEAPPPTASQDAARDRASRVVGNARVARRWTEDDAQALRELLPSMTADQRKEVVLPLFAAINRDELFVEADRPF